MLGREIPPDLDITVYRDSVFKNLGLLNHNLPKMLAFVESLEFLTKALAHPNLTCILTSSNLADQIPERMGVLIAESPRLAFFKLHNYLARHSNFYDHHKYDSRITASAEIHPTAWISSQGVVIGERVKIEPHVVILEGTIIEEDVIIRAGAVIGGQGFEFRRTPEGVLPVEHIGGVWIKHRAEIQSNASVNRALFSGYTQIGEDTKIDDLVYISHNVNVGARVLIAGHTNIGGSTTIGDDSWIGLGVQISHALSIGSRVFIGMGATITKDILDDQTVIGKGTGFVTVDPRFESAIIRHAVFR